MGIEISAGYIFYAAVVAASMYMKHQQMKRLEDSLRQDTEQSGTSIKSNTRGSDAPLKIIYGTMRVGGNNVYVSTLGNKNKQLYYAHTLCEGPIEGIKLDGAGDPYIWFDGDLVEPKYNGKYEYDEKHGTATQAADTLITTAIPGFTDPMHNTAYVAWHLRYDEDLYRGIPEIQYLIDGMKMVDISDSTSSDRVWSNNPAIALYDFLTNNRYGVGLSTSLIDEDSFIEAIDYCASKGFEISMAADPTGSNIWKIVTDILSIFRGSLNYWDGKYYLRFSDMYEESSVFTIEDEHIYQTDDGKAMVTVSDPGYYEIPNGISVSFINAYDNLYVDDSFVIGEEDGVLKKYNAIGITNKEQASIMATYILERSQLSRSISGRFRDDAITLEPNDLVKFNSTALSIADQDMRVVSAVYTNSGFVDLILQYEALSLYDDIYNGSADSVYNTTLPDPSLPSTIEFATITEVSYTQRLRTFSKFEIDFDIPADTWFKEAEVWISTDGDVDANYTHQMTVTDSFTIDPVEENATYWIVLRAVNIWGTKQTFALGNKLTKTVIGQSQTPPDSLTYLNAIAGDGSVSLRSTKLLDPDIEIYEFRVGDQWSGGIFLSAKRSPHEELSLVTPGTHVFWCNTKGTNGLYGTTPQTATVTVAVPKGWSSYTSFVDDYLDSTSGQVFVNTEHLTYAVDDYLECSHDPAYIDSTAVTSYLNGYYISEQFDNGIAADLYYTFVDTEIVTVGAGSTWDDLFLDSTSSTWADVNANTRTWQDMFEVGEAPQVTIRIWYKATLGDAWSYIENAQILASVVIARYYRVEINVTDPADNVHAYVKNYTLNLYN